MTKTDQIIENYLKGKSSDEELKFLLHFLQEKPENREYFQNQKEKWENSEDKTYTLPEWEAWTRLKNKISGKSKPRTTAPSWLAFYKAASVAAIVLLTSVIIGIPLLQKQKVIVSTQAGQIINMVLPDSSSVILNSNSTLEYHPLAFMLKREISLKGEAYFDVRKKRNTAFRVVCDAIDVKVKGTRFNVNAYSKNESSNVVLEEGTVVVKPKKNKKKAIQLSPGEKLEINLETKECHIEQVNTRLYTSWKEGILYFYDSSFDEVISRIETRYGTEMEINNEIINSFVISTTIKDEPLEKVLDLFKKVLPITINEKGGIISIKLDEERYKKYTMKGQT
jgi:ferric-dicitrate binding protein FerR (iron transport regulator)